MTLRVIFMNVVKYTPMNSKKIITAIVVVLILVIGIYFITKGLRSGVSSGPLPVGTSTEPVAQVPVATTTVSTNPATEVIGKSAGNLDITAYHFGTGSTEVLFVGGSHGGYEWNTSLVAYNLISYLQQNPSAVPANETVTVIPVLNPDGLQKVVGTTGSFVASDVSTSKTVQVSGRYNANGVDLNRNFDCDWKANAVWQNTPVSGGTSAFSEPETQAIQKYVTAHKIAASVTWYSSAGGVYSSNCHTGVSSQTNTLTQTFAKASGYPAHESFDFYATTGDMVNWFAKKNIPAISVLLTNHTDTEWDKNQAGVEAVLKQYAQL